MITLGNFVLLIISFCCSQPESYFKEISNGCIVAYNGDSIVDTLCVYKSDSRVYDRNQLIGIVNGRVIRVHKIVPGVASFQNAYMSIEEWVIENNKFTMKSSLQVPKKDCYFRKLRLQLTNSGIEWRYKRGFFKENKSGLIPYSVFNESKEYQLPCE